MLTIWILKMKLLHWWYDLPNRYTLNLDSIYFYSYLVSPYHGSGKKAGRCKGGGSAGSIYQGQMSCLS